MQYNTITYLMSMIIVIHL